MSGPALAPALTGEEKPPRSRDAAAAAVATLAWTFDERMLGHRELPAAGGGGGAMAGLHPERPDRVRAIYEHLTEAGLLAGADVLRLPSREVSRQEVELVRPPPSLARPPRLATACRRRRRAVRSSGGWMVALHS